MLAPLPAGFLSRPVQDASILFHVMVTENSARGFLCAMAVEDTFSSLTLRLREKGAHTLKVFPEL